MSNISLAFHEVGVQLWSGLFDCAAHEKTAAEAAVE